MKLAQPRPPHTLSQLGAALTLIAVSSAVWADDAPTAQVESVVVTATHRPQKLADVPIAVTVVGGDTLAQDNINSAETLTEAVPTLTFRKGNTNKDSAMNIRGVGTISFASGVEPSVSTVIDGVVYARPGQATLDFLNIDHVEVLQGPQGTLFGKNASAGVVNIVTKPIDKATTGYVDASWFEGHEARLGAGVSGSVNDAVRASLAAYLGSYEGNVTNVYNGDTVNGYNHKGVRARFDLALRDDLDGTVIADWSHNKDNGTADIISSVHSTAYNNAVLLPALAPVSPTPTNLQINNDLNPLTEDTNWGLSAQFNWHVNDYTLTSITAYRFWDNYQQRDGDFTSSYPAYVNSGTAAGNVSTADHGTLDFHQISQELRITSPRDQFLEYVGGLFYFQTDESDWFNRAVASCTASALAASNGITPCAAGSSTYTHNVGDAQFESKLKNYAAYGDATLNFTKDIRGIAGLRVTRDELSYNFARTSTSATSFPGVNPAFSASGSDGHNGVSGRLGGQYDFSSNIHSYATYTHGYKGPAYNVFFNMQPTDTKALAPETSNSYEVGLKSSAFDNKLVTALAAWYTQYRNYQANFYDTVDGLTVSHLTNAGDVSSRGVSLDFTARPIAALNLGGGIAYTRAKIDEFNCPPPAAANCAASVNGQPLPYAPKWKSVVRADYTIPLHNTDYDVVLGTSYTWQSATQYDLAQSPDGIQGAYGLWDANITLANYAQGMRYSLLVKNIGDKYYTISRVPTGTYVRQIAPRDAERYWGINVRKDF
ncbi:Pesticin receptor precursor [Amantichitinum ursilacus]|uniref:Pesticin receptor n=1 Tax=Amantichitinum ursilacus TaxID=857265 RepID=A0A0N0GQ19_9NEIS|nr:TonB-dependent receptor [Amantichitinum ursilacus]KPC54212.1 Pesticin receptor precursor [Amantichitinum ursilacus]